MEKFVIANWKMHLGIRESVALAKMTLLALQGREVAPKVVLLPSFLALAEVHKLLARSRVALGAQNVGPDRFGAFTGEVGVGHLEDVGCAYVLLGHSERRVHFGETDELLRKKIHALFQAKHIRPILCVGDTQEERDAGLSIEAVTRMLRRSLAAVDVPKGTSFPLLAYEPYWAIGTGQQPTPHEVLVLFRAMREVLHELFPQQGSFQIVYGGSVRGDNAYALLREPEIDGVLVGGASLKVQEFQSILTAACEVMTYQSTP